MCTIILTYMPPVSIIGRDLSALTDQAGFWYNIYLKGHLLCIKWSKICPQKNRDRENFSSVSQHYTSRFQRLPNSCRFRNSSPMQLHSLLCNTMQFHSPSLVDGACTDPLYKIFPNRSNSTNRLVKQKISVTLTVQSLTDQ